MAKVNLPGLGELDLPDVAGENEQRQQPPSLTTPPEKSDDNTNALGHVGELFQRIPGGVASTFLSMGEGILGLTDVFNRRVLGDTPEEAAGSTTNEWIEELRQARNHVNTKGWFSPTKGYENSTMGALGHGLGSLAGIVGTGGTGAAFRGAGLAGKFFASTRLSGVVGIGASEQADRQRDAEARGIVIPQNKKDLSTLLAGFVVGPTELMTFSKLLAPLIGKTEVHKNFFLHALGSLRRALVTAGTEGVQEAGAAILQDGIAKGLYDPSIDIFKDKWNEFGLGAGVGGIAHLGIEAIAGRKLRRAMRKGNAEAKAKVPELREAYEETLREARDYTHIPPGATIPLKDDEGKMIFKDAAEWAGTVADVAGYDLPLGPYRAIQAGKDTYQVAGQGNQIIGGHLFTKKDADLAAETFNTRQEEIATAREDAGLNMRYRQQAALSGMEPTKAVLEATRQVHQAAGLFTAPEVKNSTVQMVNAWRAKTGQDQGTTFSLRDMIKAKVPKREITQYLKKRLRPDAPIQLSKAKLFEEIARLADQRKLFHREDPSFRRFLDTIVGENQLSDMNKTQLATVVDVLRRIPVQDYRTGLSVVTDPTYSPEEFEKAVEFYRGKRKKPSLEDIGGAIGSTDQTKLQDIQNTIARIGAARMDPETSEYIVPEPQDRRPINFIDAENKTEMKKEVSRSPDGRAPIYATEPVSPEEMSKWERVAQILERRLRDLGLTEYGVKSVDFIRRMGRIEAGDLSVRGEITNSDGVVMGRVIRVAMEMIEAKSGSETDLAKAAAKVLNHEVVHALRTLDLITDGEFEVVAKYAAKTIRPGATGPEGHPLQGEPLTYLQWAVINYAETRDPITGQWRRKENAPERADIEEEAFAEVYRAWADNPQTMSERIGGIFGRITEFFSRLGNALAGNGFRTAEDVFEAISSGEIGRRERGLVRALSTMSPQRAAEYGFIDKKDLQRPIGDAPDDLGETTPEEQLRQGVVPDKNGVVEDEDGQRHSLREADYAADRGGARRDRPVDRGGEKPLERPPVEADGSVRLFHWSKQEGLAALDPVLNGTGHAGEENRRKRTYPDLWEDRTYYGIAIGETGGYVKELALGPNLYIAGVPAESLYDFRNDPDNFFDIAREQFPNDWPGQVTLYERLIKEADYSGYWAKNKPGTTPQGLTAAVFEPLEVSPSEENFEAQVIARPEPSERLSLLGHDGDHYFAGRHVRGQLEEATSPHSRTTLIYLPPSVFLRMAHHGKDHKAQAEVDDLLEQGAAFNSLPSLMFSYNQPDKRKALVVTHDGRHRSRALERAGVKLMPVLFTSTPASRSALYPDREPMGAVRWGREDTHWEPWPEVLQAQGNSPRPLDTISFPDSVIFPHDPGSAARLPTRSWEAVVDEPVEQFSTLGTDTRDNPPEIRGTGGRSGTQRTIRDVAAYLMDKGERLDPANPEHRALAAQRGAEEYLYQTQQAKSGKGWYGKDLFLTFGYLNTLPELKGLLAFDEDIRRLWVVLASITSGGVNPVLNVNSATRLLSHAVDPVRPGANRIEFLRDMPQLQEDGSSWPGYGGADQRIEVLNRMIGELGLAGAMKELISFKTPEQLREMRREYSNWKAGMPKGIRLDHKSPLYGVHMFGPKYGNFSMSLMGTPMPVMDKWFTRGFNRHFGQLLAEEGRPGKVSSEGIIESPRNPEEREQMLDWIMQVAERVGDTPEETQAVLWFFEQQLYDALGVPSNPMSLSDGGQTYLEAAGRSLPEQRGSDSRFGFTQISAGQPEVAGREQPAGDRQSYDAPGDAEADIPFETFSRRDLPRGGEFEGSSAAGERPLLITKRGQQQTFFAKTTSGTANGPTKNAAYIPILDLNDADEFSRVYMGYVGGNFDRHIAGMIPGFQEVQQYVGQTIADLYDGGATMLDIGASEGAFIKAISALTQGRIKTLGLDPSPEMHGTFQRAPTPKGAKYRVEAFSNAHEEGVHLWDEGLVPIFGFRPVEKYDIVHEAMTFQFINNRRDVHIARVKELMKSDGIAIFEEKFVPGSGLSKSRFVESEEFKIGYQSRYFEEADLIRDLEEVITGMAKDQIAPGSFERILKNNFENVAQFWDSGNFKGYIVSDSVGAFSNFLDALPSTDSEFSTIDTPRIVKGDFNLQLPENEDFVWAEREYFSKLPYDAFHVVPSNVTGADNYGQMMFMGKPRHVVLFKGYHDEFDIDEYGGGANGFGHAHIAAGHAKEIRGLGYPSLRALVSDFVNQMWTQRNNPAQKQADGSYRKLFSSAEDSRRGTHDPTLVVLWQHPQHGPIRMVLAPKLLRGHPILSVTTLYPVDVNAPDAMISSRPAIQPQINERASPAALEAVKKQGRPILRLKPEAREEYSKRQVIDSPEEEAIYQRTGNRDPRYTWGERFLGATQTQPFVRWRQRWLNKYEAIGRIGLVAAKQRAAETGRPLNDYLMADVAAMSSALLSDRAAGVAAEAFKTGVPVYRDGYVRVVTENPVDGFHQRGLVDVLGRVMKDGVTAQFALYSQARRASGSLRRRGIGTGQMTPEAIALGLRKGEEYPWFADVFNEYQRWNSALVQLMIDSGVIDEAAGRMWIETWDYTPYYRQLEYGESGGRGVPKIFNSIANVTPPRRMRGLPEGQGAPFNDFIENVTRNAMSAITASMKNIAAQRAVRDAQHVGVARRVPPNSGVSDTVTIRVRGQNQIYQITDPLLFAALTSVNSQSKPIHPFLSFPAQLLRGFVTREPGFIVANLLRDTLSAWATSGRTDIPFVETAVGFGEALGNVGAARSLRRSGVYGGFDFKGDITDVAKTFRGINNRNPAVRLWRALDHLTSASDAATRAAVYSDVLAKTGNEAQATFEALEVINFSRRGNSDLMRYLSGMVPFFNARVQGLDLLYRAGTGAGVGKGVGVNRKEAMKNFYLRGLFMIGMNALYTLSVMDDDAWKNANPETRDQNWLFGTGKGHQAVKMPIAFEVGLLTKTLPERIIAYFMGYDTQRDLEQAGLRNFMATLGMNPMPQALKPIFEVWMNKSMYTQRPIVGEYLQNLQSQLRFTTGTSETAKAIGDTALMRAIGMSPAELDHLFRGYTGTLGAYGLFMLDEGLRSVVDLPTGQRPAMKPEDWPFVKRFLTKELQTGNLALFYDFRNQARQAARSAHELAKTGRYAAYGTLTEKERRMIAVSGYTEDLARSLAGLRSARRVINDDTTIDKEPKRRLMDEIRRLEIMITADAKRIRREASK